MSARFHGYLSVQGRGTVTLPADLRRRFHLDEPGAQLELTERADGIIEMRAVLPVPAAERWFWDARWKEGEREVGLLMERGEFRTHDGVDAFLEHLDDLDRLDS
jgi:bifunctional DNA-binding transcriptional regulator/antitoxin component of YhaV-PrlF toxin-antitoxin module